MSVILVTYDLVSPGQNYQPVYDYLKTHSYCKGLESVWLLDTNKTAQFIRDELNPLVDDNDKVFVVKITRSWASLNYYCGDWLNKSERSF